MACTQHGIPRCGPFFRHKWIPDRYATSPRAVRDQPHFAEEVLHSADAAYLSTVLRCNPGFGRILRDYRYAFTLRQTVLGRASVLSYLHGRLRPCRLSDCLVPGRRGAVLSRVAIDRKAPRETCCAGARDTHYPQPGC